MIIIYWYFVLMVTGIPTQIGPFDTQDQCIEIREQVTKGYTTSISYGTMTWTKCWKIQVK